MLESFELSAVLPVEKISAFKNFFAAPSYCPAGCYAEEVKIINEESNDNEVALIGLNIESYFELNDLINNDYPFADFCKQMNVKRLAAYRQSPSDMVEESLIYSRKNGFDYQRRDFLPMPCTDCYLDEDETIDDNEAEAE